MERGGEGGEEGAAWFGMRSAGPRRRAAKAARPAPTATQAYARAEVRLDEARASVLQAQKRNWERSRHGAKGWRGEGLGSRSDGLKSGWTALPCKKTRGAPQKPRQAPMCWQLMEVWK